MGNLLHSCAKVCEPIELSFGMVSGVSLGIGVLDGIQCAPRERFCGVLMSVYQYRICHCIADRDVFGSCEEI